MSHCRGVHAGVHLNSAHKVSLTVQRLQTRLFTSALVCSSVFANVHLFRSPTSAHPAVNAYASSPSKSRFTRPLKFPMLVFFWIWNPHFDIQGTRFFPAHIFSAKVSLVFSARGLKPRRRTECPRDCVASRSREPT